LDADRQTLESPCGLEPDLVSEVMAYYVDKPISEGILQVGGNKMLVTFDNLA